MSGLLRQVPIVCPGHTRPLSELQFTFHPSDGLFLMSACHDKAPMLRRGSTGDWIGTFQGHKGAVWSAKLDPTAERAATASGDFTAAVWDAITGAQLVSFQHKHIVRSIEFSPCGSMVATGGHEGVCRIFDLKSGATTPVHEFKAPGPTANINKVCWGSDPSRSSLVFCGASDGAVKVWDIRSGLVAHSMSVSGHVMDMELSEGSLQQLTVSAGTAVTFFDVRSFQAIKSFEMPVHFRDEGGASLHPSGTKFIAGGSDLWVRVFDAENGKELECHKGHHGPIRCMRYTPDGTAYATGSEDGTIRIWKTDLAASE